MALRVIALAPPGHISGTIHSKLTIKSSDPASLFNACRVAGFLAEQKIGAWGESNWIGSRKNRRQKLLLMYSYQDDLPIFEELLLKEKPNLLLIGSMTICFPGAIACAKRARELLGDQVYIVLGGRHINETFYINQIDQSIAHHVASPLELMHKQTIPDVFDLVVSGDGEYLIAHLGELVARTLQEGKPLNSLPTKFAAIENIPGNWLIGWIENRHIKTIISNKIPYDYNQLPVPCGVFGVQTAFDIYPGCLTAHVFSDIGRGCAYDCNFCSERRSVAGSLQQLNSSSGRLYKQLATACLVIKEDNPNFGCSAFVEDSLILAGNVAALNDFSTLLEQRPLNIQFGAQLSIDQILLKKSIVTRLAKVGLDYLFIGLETFLPEEIGGMSKDVQKNKDSWVNRAEQAFKFLYQSNIRCGAAILFGLGESHLSRLHLLKQIQIWQQEYGMPLPISMNWAVQHPLQNKDGGKNYLYLDWATPSGPFLDVFHDFGEASYNYPLYNVAPPVLSEIIEVRDTIKNLNNIINKTRQEEYTYVQH